MDLLDRLKALKLSDDHQTDLKRYIKNHSTLDVLATREALDIIGLKLPQWKVRQIFAENEHKKELTTAEFIELANKLKQQEVAQSFKWTLSTKKNLEKLGGISEASAGGTTHSVRHEEQLAFSNWINTYLRDDIDLKNLLPIEENGKTFYDKIKNGILLCKLINHSYPDFIDERAINKEKLTVYTKHENLTLALNSAQAIGCNIINIDAHDLSKGRPHLVLGLLWQIIRIGLFNHITIEHCPGLVNLLKNDEEMTDLLKESPETTLIRWVNYQLKNTSVKLRMTNFTNDIKNSEIYTHLLYQIAPKEMQVSKKALEVKDLLERAEVMLQQADKLGCRNFVTPENVAITPNHNLNLAFLAHLFSRYPALNIPDNFEFPIEEIAIDENREERTYRNWINSMGVSSHVKWLYSDLTDGLIIIELFDMIKPGSIDWNRGHKVFSKLKGFMEKLENCNYAVELGKQLNFSLVGIDGQNIKEGNRTLTLAMVWQLMRAYTLIVLSKLTAGDLKKQSNVEAEIVKWVNKKLLSVGKTSTIKNFGDSIISTAAPVIDLIDAIKPGSINYRQILSGNTPEVKLANAKYAISIARKIGARIYAIPEDIAEVKSKMAMTVFACLMALDYIPNMDSKTATLKHLAKKSELLNTEPNTTDF